MFIAVGIFLVIANAIVMGITYREKNGYLLCMAIFGFAISLTGLLFCIRNLP